MKKIETTILLIYSSLVGFACCLLFFFNEYHENSSKYYYTRGYDRIGKGAGIRTVEMQISYLRSVGRYTTEHHLKH